MFRIPSVSACVLTAALSLLAARDAEAQLDPLLFVKRVQPNVLVLVDTGNRMQRDLDNNYRDPFVFTRNVGLHPWEATLDVTAANTTANYRRIYRNLVHTDPAAGGDKFAADRIDIVRDTENGTDLGFTRFDERTRLAVARRALVEAINRNIGVARFSLIRMRQSGWAAGGELNETPVRVSDPSQDDELNDNNGLTGKWRITRSTVAKVNGDPTLPTGLMFAADAANATVNARDLLALNPGQVAGALTGLGPGGRDSMNSTDAPVDNMLDDAKTEAVRLAGEAGTCRNTVAILVVGGSEGQSTGENPAAKALEFLNIGANHRVPIYVIALGPTAADNVDQLKAIATNSGGVYTEITSAMVEAVFEGLSAGAAVPAVPEAVRAVNFAVQHAFAAVTDFDTDPTPALPIGPYTEHHVTSPIIGSVNLEGAKDIDGNALENDAVQDPRTNVKIPQRSNMLLTTGFSLPGFEAKLRAFRVYKPVVDEDKPSGHKFVADGTRLWPPYGYATAPAAASRNIYTSLPDGTMVAFTAANAAQLAPYLVTTDAAALIDYIRSQPLGAVVGSTPALMDVPSLDPPPDPEYPGFADDNKGRRSMIWVGADDGMLHGIDARLGREVWAFIPFNLLPKLKTLLYGQAVGSFRYFVDSSPKVADVKVADKWRTYLIIGQGSGGTFYQTFDVTLDDMVNTVAADSNDVNQVLTYFSSLNSVPLKWSFPKYSDFDYTLAPWGDIAAAAPNIPGGPKTVGQTWSDPAVGQIANASGKYAVLTGSGFYPYTAANSGEQAANRGGTKAGTTFYLLDIEDGSVFDSHDVGGTLAETVDNCAAINNCNQLKNALQADPVATGPAESRYITMAYIGDLDGKLWRFDIRNDAAGNPEIFAQAELMGGEANAKGPLFSSLATVNVGGKNYLFFAQGSDLLPSNGVNYAYRLYGILDLGNSGSVKANLPLATTDGAGDDEKVTSFPAVAGDIVFFTTTSYKPAALCSLPDGNLYALTFIGGPAYDSNNSNSLTDADRKVRTTVGARASAPFIVDQHLVFAAGGKIEMFGDPEDFNNGVGQAGVRILSWREVR